MKVLNELNCKITLDDTKFIFKRFDKNFDSRLDFNEFCEMILPRTYEYKRILNERNENSFFVGFSLESKEKIREFFKCLINALNSIEYFRNMLNRESENLLEIYNMLRKEYKQGIYLEDIIEFLCENGLRKNLNNVDILFEYLDKKKDGIISYDEFAQLICPMI
jgi:Ca2+-binding EF-hand superfamily protein